MNMPYAEWRKSEKGREALVYTCVNPLLYAIPIVLGCFVASIVDVTTPYRLFAILIIPESIVLGLALYFSCRGIIRARASRRIYNILTAVGDSFIIAPNRLDLDEKFLCYDEKSDRLFAVLALRTRTKVETLTLSESDVKDIWIHHPILKRCCPKVFSVIEIHSMLTVPERYVDGLTAEQFRDIAT